MSEVTLVREPRTYSKDSPNSFFGDVVRSSNSGWQGHHDAVARLERHGLEVETEIRDNPHSAESRRASVEIRNLGRAEFRAATSSTIAGFTTPEYLLKNYRLYRENPPSLLEQLNCQDIPEFGLQTNVPVFTAGASVTAQTEGSAIATAVPTATANQGTISAYNGSVLVSQQLMDRAGPGMTFDTFVHAQLMQEWEAAIDSALIAAALAATPIAISRATAKTPPVIGLWSDLFNARGQLEDEAGVKLRPTHIFFQPTQWAWWASQVDASTSRPVIVPAPMGADMPMRVPEVPSGDATGILAPAGYTGYAFGGVPVFTDNSIPSSGSNSQILVLNGSSIVPFVQKVPTLQALDQTVANDLQVVLRLNGYATFNIVYPKGLAVISGAAYPAAPAFA